MTTTYSTPKRQRGLSEPISVDLAGETITVHRPKDWVLVQTDVLVSENAREEDIAAVIVEFLQAVMSSEDWARFQQRVADGPRWPVETDNGTYGDDHAGDPLNLGAVMDMIVQLRDRWSDYDAHAGTLVITAEPSSPLGDAHHEIDDDHDLDLVCWPPKDVMMMLVAGSGLSSSGVTAGMNYGMVLRSVMTFLQASLMPEQDLLLARRLRNQRDTLDVEQLVDLGSRLMEQWQPGANRQQKRAQKKAATSKKKPAGGTQNQRRTVKVTKE